MSVSTEVDAVVKGPTAAVTVASVGSGPLRYSVSAPAGLEIPSKVTVVARSAAGRARHRAPHGLDRIVVPPRRPLAASGHGPIDGRGALGRSGLGWNVMDWSRL